MEEKILDNPLKEPSLRHSRLSFKLFLWTLAIFCIPLALSIMPTIWLFKLSNSMSDMLFGLPAIGMLITGMGSFRHAIHSIRKQEPWVYQKVIGFTGSLIFILLFIFLLLINVMDLVDIYS